MFGRNMKKLILLLLLQGCSVVDIFCTDEAGTYLCPCTPENQLNCRIEDAVEDKIRIEIEDWFKE